MKPKNKYPLYSFRSEGTPTSFAILDSKKFIVNNEEITKVKNYELPIDGYMITTCGEHEKSEPIRIGCKDRAYYFFDASYGRKKEGQFTHKEAIAVLRGNETVNKWLYDHMGSNVTKEDNGKYYLKRLGQWDKVSEETYFTKVETIHREHTLKNQKWHITFQSIYGESPYKIEGIVDANTGEILSVKAVE